MKKPKIIILLLLSLVLASCSQERMLRLMTKTPKIEATNQYVQEIENKYQKDAIYLVELIKQTYPRLDRKISNYEQISREFIEKIYSIKSDLDFEIELKRFIAKLEDGHSSFYISYSKSDDKRFQFYVFKEKENWILGNVEKSIDSIAIGKRIKSINGLNIEEIENRISSFENGENKYWKFHNALRYFQYPSYWKALNVTAQDNQSLIIILENFPSDITIELQKKTTSEGYKIVKKPLKYPFRLKQNNGFFTKTDALNNFGYLQMNTSLDLVSIKKDINNYTNFLTKPFAMSFLKKETKDAKDFGKVLQVFFQDLNKNSITNLIIDLSYNTGGSEDLGKQLIWYLTENENIRGFSEYVYNSDYFKQQIKADYNKYNSLHIKKYGVPLPEGEVNITNLLDEKYFESIENSESPYLLDKTIPKFRGKVYVITSPVTFSAGQVLATTLSDNGLATIVGEPTGNKPTTQTGASMFKLPHTKKIVLISYIYMERPDQTKNKENALYPDIETQNTYNDFLNGDDKVMEYILSTINLKSSIKL